MAIQKNKDDVPVENWAGSICFGTDRDLAWLLMAGVKMGPEKPGGWHPCTMTEEVLQKVNPYWGTFFWELHPAGREHADEKGFYYCEFCTEFTNAEIRECCPMGAKADNSPRGSDA